MAFLNAAGTVMHKTLRAGERLLVDTDSLVAFENSCSYEIRMVDGGCAMMCWCVRPAPPRPARPPAGGRRSLTASFWSPARAAAAWASSTRSSPARAS